MRSPRNRLSEPRRGGGGRGVAGRRQHAARGTQRVRRGGRDPLRLGPDSHCVRGGHDPAAAGPLGGVSRAPATCVAPGVCCGSDDGRIAARGRTEETVSGRRPSLGAPAGALDPPRRQHRSLSRLSPEQG